MAELPQINSVRSAPVAPRASRPSRLGPGVEGPLIPFIVVAVLLVG